MTHLNRTAAIATIVGTVFAAVALIHQLSTDDIPVVAIIERSAGPAAIEGGPAIPADAAKEEDGVVEDVVAPTAASTTTQGKFDTRIYAATLITIYSNRAEAFLGIARDASDAGDYASAIRAAREIEVYSSKDEALAYVARKALSAGKKSVAIEAAALMQIYSNKDAVLAEIAAK